MAHHRILFEEYAGHGSFSINENLTISAMAGWIRQRGDRGDVIVFDPPMPPYGEITRAEPFQEVVYFVPSAKISAAIFRFDLGAIVYDILDGSNSRIFNYPFNGVHKIRPSLGLEIGENNLYIVIKFLDSFPLYSGMGLSEVGLGGRVSGAYEQRAVVIGGPFGAVGLGYRAANSNYIRKRRQPSDLL